MPLPFIIAGVAGAAGIAGVVKGGQAVSKNSKAKSLNDSAQYVFEEARRQLETQRDLTSTSLNALGEIKLCAWNEDVRTFVECFKAFKKVSIEGSVNLDENLKLNVQNPKSLGEMQSASMRASEIVKAGVGSLGAGALAGIASYGGAMMFASASTGTAIATLSGAAATNATLAFFGGGSLAAGGLGIAGGSLVLGGIVAGPVLAVAGFIMAAKAEENLASAEKRYSEAKNAAAQMDIITTFLNGVEQVSDQLCKFITDFRSHNKYMLKQLRKMRDNAYEEQGRFIWNRIKSVFGIKHKINYKKLSGEQKQLLHKAWLMAQLLHGICSAPILTESGDLDENIRPALKAARSESKKLIGGRS